jgi:ribosomal protein S27AE
MKQRFAVLSLSGILMLAAFGREGAAQHSHNWYFLNIYAIVDTGNDNAHRIDGLQKCAVAGETQYGSTFESHGYQFTWYSYYQHTSDKHIYKTEHRCPTCGHVKNTNHYQSHVCESIWDTHCSQCGYTNIRMCG